FLGMQQPALDPLARSHVQHCDLLEARMKVTAYILHIRPPSSRALRSFANRVYSRLLGAVARHPIKPEVGEGSAPRESTQGHRADSSPASRDRNDTLRRQMRPGRFERFRVDSRPHLRISA